MCFLLECGRCFTIPIFHNILEVSLTRFKIIVNDSVEECDIGSANDSMLTLIHPQNLASLFPQKVKLKTWLLFIVIIIREFIGKSNFLILYWY
ncbi:hypothetical protein T02_11884 [Trichinella nativa]|uniref:Uncharacterized protein n=1 Tax=Trichinella nativa TaxID=6335 RepID=A0A0V1KX05_9BILA|nr:hypothetical protein T02_11884 [Trichinella nativa]